MGNLKESKEKLTKERLLRALKGQARLLIDSNQNDYDEILAELYAIKDFTNYIEHYEENKKILERKEDRYYED